MAEVQHSYTRHSLGGCVEVCVDNMKDLQSPHCPHGPTLLFERFYKNNKPSRRFYACSACRDRKDCSFFQWADEKVTDSKLQMRQEINQSMQPSILPRSQLQERLCRFQACSNDADRNYCHDCENLFFLSETDNHSKHNITRRISLQKLNWPASILRPLTGKKTNAQYLFSRNACQFLYELLIDLSYDYVICVGTPSLHEFIGSRQKMVSKNATKLQSVLLDIDHRYIQFYPKDTCRYNLFNCYFFDEDSNRQIYQDFISSNESGKGAIIVDPPFGGLMQVIAKSLRQLWRITSGKEIPTLLIFPYYLENHVKEHLNHFVMLDYKVDYDNHPSYNNHKYLSNKSKRQSPVRIFTNIQPDKIVLPPDEGYKYCGKCQRYVGEENVHCILCNSCTSKDGRTYVHCKKCEKCVKPDRAHCNTCRACLPKNHQCNRSLQGNGCYICGQYGHKHRQCSLRSMDHKRKQNGNDIRCERNKKKKAEAIIL